ncbi:MAG: hypothetical protein WB816_18570 [Methylocystis sp.]
MSQYAIKSIVAAGIVAAVATLAAASSAMALETYRSYDEGCARWSSQGAGQRIKCFDCLERRQLHGRTVWVNTCAHAPY